MLESLDDFIRILWRPQDVDYLVEVPANQVRNISKERECSRVHQPDTKVRINNVDAQRHLVKKCLQLRLARVQGLLGLLSPSLRLTRATSSRALKGLMR